MEARGLTHTFDSGPTLRFPDFQIEPGERLTIVGDNGTGKSTLLRLIAGLLTPSTGTLTGVPPPGRTVLLHQEPYFFRGTGRDNIEWAHRFGPRRMTVDELLERVGARDFASRTAKDLSGGERRRLALARALAVDPECLLLDEPYAGLDEAGRTRVEEILSTLTTTVLISSPRPIDGPTLQL